MIYNPAPDIKSKIDEIIEKLNFSHIDKGRIFCIRSFDVNTRAIARIWGMAPIFNQVANLPVTYIIEVNHKRFDKQKTRDQMKILIHELMHIPKTFSGALLSHKGRYHKINDINVEKLMQKLE